MSMMPDTVLRGLAPDSKSRCDAAKAAMFIILFVSSLGVAEGEMSLQCHARPIVHDGSENSLDSLQHRKSTSREFPESTFRRRMLALGRFEEEWRGDLYPEDIQRFRLLKGLGGGQQGFVVAAEDLATGKMVAIKQIKPAFHGGNKNLNGLKTLRELAYLRAFNNSDHIMHIHHAFLPRDKDSFDTVYFATEFMDATMSSKDTLAQFRALPADIQRNFFFDVLSALADMHAAGVYHRDVKFDNLGVNNDCNFKLLDFGIAAPARGNDFHDWRWVSQPHPPELMPVRMVFPWKAEYDIWAAGCLFLNAMVAGEFPAVCKSKANGGIQSIVRILGIPNSEALAKYEHEEGRIMFERAAVNESEPVGLAGEYPELDARLLAVVGRMLDLDPENRPSAAELLKDSLFYGIARKREASKNKPVDTFQSGLTAEEYRSMVYSEILNNYVHAGIGNDGSPDVVDHHGGVVESGRGRPRHSRTSPRHAMHAMNEMK